jgi:hypothetical protein
MMIAVVLFAMAATGGLVLAGIRFSGRPYPPLALALVHGAAAGSALVALILAVAGGDAPVAAKVSLAMFLGAAVGGFVLLSHHLRKVALPIWLVVVHALVAISAFLVLLTTVL